MPIDPGLANSIMGALGGSNIMDVGVNALLQKQANKRSQKWQEKMYDRQRADALADWNLQNQYNSPVAQMGRLKAAKLNPNLIYGTGVQASGLSGSVRSSSPGSFRYEAPKVDLSGASAIGGFMDAKMKQTQIDTMKTVQEVNNARKNQIDADVILKGAQKGMLDISTAARSFKLGLDKSLVGVTVDTASAQLDKLRAEKDRVVTETMFKMHEDMRRELLTKATLSEKYQRVALMAAQEAATKAGIPLTQQKVLEIQAKVVNDWKSGRLLSIEGDLKQWDYDLRKSTLAQDWLRTILGGLKKR